ncbi:MAG: hypothetical protein Q8R24_02565 [Legionellaceae bacterium]|nr:hypothetical protein [Legionellaceae bacterium]
MKINRLQSLLIKPLPPKEKADICQQIANEHLELSRYYQAIDAAEQNRAVATTPSSSLPETQIERSPTIDLINKMQLRDYLGRAKGSKLQMHLTGARDLSLREKSVCLIFDMNFMRLYLSASITEIKELPLTPQGLQSTLKAFHMTNPNLISELKQSMSSRVRFEQESSPVECTKHDLWILLSHVQIPETFSPDTTMDEEVNVSTKKSMPNIINENSFTAVLQKQNEKKIQSPTGVDDEELIFPMDP